ncbi:MAG: hypothetical protein ABR508_10790 [Candidatus Baltobacteraceae bacterium]
MQQPLNTVELRPLRLGEILDRAVTLLVRHWVPFVLVLKKAFSWVFASGQTRSVFAVALTLLVILAEPA